MYLIEPLRAYALTRYEELSKFTFLHPELYSAKDFIEQAFGDLDPVPEVPSMIARGPSRAYSPSQVGGPRVFHRR